MPEILQVNKKTKEIKRIPVTENHYKLLMSRNHFKNGGTYLAPAEFGAYFGALPEPEQAKQPEPIQKPEPQKPDTLLEAADTLMATMGFERVEEKTEPEAKPTPETAKPKRTRKTKKPE